MTEGPRLGDTVYLDREGSMPVIVLHKLGTTIYTAPAEAVRSGHQGNFYNAQGESQWRV